MCACVHVYVYVFVYTHWGKKINRFAPTAVPREFRDKKNVALCGALTKEIFFLGFIAGKFHTRFFFLYSWYDLHKNNKIQSFFSYARVLLFEMRRQSCIKRFEKKSKISGKTMSKMSFTFKFIYNNIDQNIFEI